MMVWILEKFLARRRGARFGSKVLRSTNRR
jgi:hypothetical protein